MPASRKGQTNRLMEDRQVSRLIDSVSLVAKVSLLRRLSNGLVPKDFLRQSPIVVVENEGLFEPEHPVGIVPILAVAGCGP